MPNTLSKTVLPFPNQEKLIESRFCENRSLTKFLKTLKSKFETLISSNISQQIQALKAKMGQ